MRRDKDGNKLARKMTVKVIYPDNTIPQRTYVQHAGPKQGFGPDGIDQMLEQVSDQLDQLYPWWQFRPVELASIGSTIRFAFIFAGNNPKYILPASQIPQTTDSTTPEPETPTNTEAEAAPEAPAILQDLVSREKVQQ